MAKNWAICIGINQYRFLKSLDCAVNDGDKMAEWLNNSQQFEKIYLFTDNSAPFTDMSEDFPSQPMFTNVKSWIRERFNKDKNQQTSVLSPSDNLWFFFSGHGWRHQGQDYLLLSDSDPHPDEIDNSAIKITWLVDYLRNSGAGNIMLFIDACRDSAKSGSGLDLSQQQGVISLASCSPNEKSYEIPELNQGSFTYALIESLTIQGENNCATVERLCKRVKRRVMALNEQYKQPKQTPIATIEPENKNRLLILPEYIRPDLDDIRELKIQALYAETKNELKLAEMLWTRLVIHDTEEALAKLKEIWSKIAIQTDVVIDQSDTSNQEVAIAQAKLEEYQKMMAAFLQSQPNSINYFKDVQFGGGYAEGNYAGDVDNKINQPLSNRRGARLAPEANSLENQPSSIPVEEDESNPKTLAKTFGNEDEPITDTSKPNLDINVNPATNVNPAMGANLAPLQKTITEDLGKGVSLEMVLIPEGNFMMGSNERKEEQPIHEVAAGRNPP
ncbi:MAG: caspase family protein [Microcystaceae cyanobacterium]